MTIKEEKKLGRANVNGFDYMVDDVDWIKTVITA